MNTLSWVLPRNGVFRPCACLRKRGQLFELAVPLAVGHHQGEEGWPERRISSLGAQHPSPVLVSGRGAPASTGHGGRVDGGRGCPAQATGQ